MTHSLPQDLRNKSFRGKNCEGWDFSGRDISGCDFRNARLDGANFRNAITGQTRKKNSIYLLTLGFFMIVGIIGRAITYSSGKAGINNFSLVNMILIILLLILPYSLLTEASFLGLIMGVWTAATVYMGWQTIEVFGYAVARLSYGLIFYAILNLFLTGIFLYITLGIARGIQQIFQDVTGTNFQGTDLQGLNFENATLCNCNLDSRKKKNFNWSYRFHDDTKIQRANLSHANLSRSTLLDLDLSFTNLTYVNAEGTHFHRTNLTGACIRDWSINSETQFDRVICDYIYLSAYRTPAYRVPASGTFKPGEFEAFVRKQTQLE